jgi:hypothetical protein
MDRSEIYRPIAERTLQNYQMQHLARKYDFGKESLVSKLIIERSLSISYTLSTSPICS